jgi:hypothetical protein
MVCRYPENFEAIEFLDVDIWDRGYVGSTDDKVWFELYVTSDFQSTMPNAEQLGLVETTNTLTRIESVILDHYEDEGQISFCLDARHSDKAAQDLTRYLERRRRKDEKLNCI